MPYNVITFEKFIQNHKDIELHVVSWGEDKKLTNYQAPKMERVFYYKKTEFNLAKLRDLYLQIVPALVYVSGRMEKDYLKICLLCKRDKVITIGSSDNQFFGGIKQKIAGYLGYFLYRRYFDYLMVPGLYQYEYARYLGFSRDQILMPQYSANTELFKNQFTKDKLKTNSLKNTILFIGRLNKVKGIDILIKVHKRLYNENIINEKLMVIGNGPLHPELDLNYDGLQYFPFMDQNELVEKLHEIKYFCLPSRIEPWGVVIHEAVSAGLPLVCTSVCGAASAFLKDGYNGYVFNSDDEASLEKILIRMNQLTEDEIIKMGTRSFELSLQINPEMWGEILYQLASSR